MQILVTGGCGFIGSHLVDRLVADGHGVTVLDNLSTGTRQYLPSNVELVVGDVADARLVQSLTAKAQAVVHLAAVASVEACTRDWIGSHRTNLTGAVTVFDAAARAGKIPVIYASSAAVYGDNPALPLGEDAATVPLSAYGLDKFSAEQYAKLAWTFHGVPNVGLRFFNVYGPRQDPRSPYSGVISRFMAAIKGGQPITYYGDGKQTRDFIYVGDIVALLMRALEHAKGAAVFNGCTGTQIDLMALAATIGQVTGQDVASNHAAPKVGDIRYSCGDPARARAELGFVAETSLREGLAMLAAHG